MPAPIKWTDEYDRLLLSEFERRGNFGAVSKSLRAAGHHCTEYSARKRYMQLRPQEWESRLKKLRPGPLTHDQEQAVLRMLRNKSTCRQIAESLGVSRSSVERVRKRHGFARYKRVSDFRPQPVETLPSRTPRKQWTYIVGDRAAPVSRCEHLPLGGRFVWGLPK